MREELLESVNVGPGDLHWFQHHHQPLLELSVQGSTQPLTLTTDLQYCVKETKTLGKEEG